MTPDEIITCIVTDLRGRKGLGDEWDNIDSDVRQEIIDEWKSYLPASSEAEQRLKVTPGTFIQIAEKNPTAVGIPIYWAEWPARYDTNSEGKP